MIWKWTEITMDSISVPGVGEADGGSWPEKYLASATLIEVKL